MINGVEFEEDRTILKPMTSAIKIPEKGFEGWFYRKFPGRFIIKRVILIFIIILLFLISLILISLGKYNIDEKNKVLLQERAKVTKLK